jgi:hypothetical protein
VGFSITANTLKAFMAVRGVGVVSGTRASTTPTAFGGMSVNPGPPSLALVDVLLSATERALYVLSDTTLGVVDLAALVGGTWASAAVKAVTSVNTTGSRFAGLALSQN